MIEREANQSAFESESDREHRLAANRERVSIHRAFQCMLLLQSFMLQQWWIIHR